MEIITKNFYSDGTEIRQHDLVYLEGYDSNRDTSFKGICKVGCLSGELFSAYFLGQEIGGTYDIEVYVGNIKRLVKINNAKIDEVSKEMLELLE